MGYMIDAFIFPTRKFSVKPVLAVKLLNWRCSAIQLDEVGSATVSLLPNISTLCRASSRRKDRKGIIHIWKFKTHIF